MSVKSRTWVFCCQEELKHADAFMPKWPRYARQHNKTVLGIKRFFDYEVPAKWLSPNEENSEVFLKNSIDCVSISGSALPPPPRPALIKMLSLVFHRHFHRPRGFIRMIKIKVNILSLNMGIRRLRQIRELIIVFMVGRKKGMFLLYLKTVFYSAKTTVKGVIMSKFLWNLESQKAV